MMSAGTAASAGTDYSHPLCQAELRRDVRRTALSIKRLPGTVRWGSGESRS